MIAPLQDQTRCSMEAARSWACREIQARCRGVAYAVVILILCVVIVAHVVIVAYAVTAEALLYVVTVAVCVVCFVLIQCVACDAVIPGPCRAKASEMSRLAEEWEGGSSVGKEW
jgi:hypothetical protein